MDRKPRKCVICKKSFTPRNQLQLTCCKECSRQYKIQHQRELYRKKSKHKKQKLRTVSCLNCGRVFQTRYDTQKFCSHHCGVEYNNRARYRSKYNGKKLSPLGKINVVRWIRLRLTDGTVATNKEPYSPELCAALHKVPIEEVYAALAEYDRLVAAGRDKEFYKMGDAK